MIEFRFRKIDGKVQIFEFVFGLSRKLPKAVAVEGFVSVAFVVKAMAVFVVLVDVVAIDVFVLIAVVVDLESLVAEIDVLAEHSITVHFLIGLAPNYLYLFIENISIKK